ncbi:DoxX family protein [Naumannella sp. ID2617S]|nr:DoxX family protein [Naumannella sp. ID2617S]
MGEGAAGATEQSASPHTSERRRGDTRATSGGTTRSPSTAAGGAAGASKVDTVKSTDGTGRESKTTALGKENDRLRAEHAETHRRSLLDLELARTKNRRWTDFGLLLLRVLPIIMVLHGIHKAQGYSGFRDTVAKNHFGAMAPDVFSVMIVAGQIALPILIALGLFTRLAGLLEAVMMGFVWVLMFILQAWIDPRTGGVNGESALLYVFLTLPLLFTGAGRYSLDHLIGRGRAKSRAERRVEKRAV